MIRENIAGRLTAERVVSSRMRRCRIPDLTGMTFGSWRILYETTEEENPYCMCRCVSCGVKRMILAIKFRKGYALRCPECRVRREIAGESP